jgi:sugar/nucleoside kinase (ribokinase family)
MGGSVVDVMLRVPDTEDLSRELEVLEWTVQGGGKVATAMAAVSRLGAKGAIITKVADNQAGQFVISDFQRYGVDVCHVLVQKGCRTGTGVMFYLVSEKSHVSLGRMIDVIRNWRNLPKPVKHVIEWTDIPAEASFRKYFPEEIAFVSEGRVVNLDDLWTDGVLEAARIAKKNDIPVCLDMYGRLPDEAELLKNVSWCIPSRRAAVAFTKETDPKAICRKLLEYGPEVVGVTLGEEGAVFMTKKEVVEVKAFKVPVVDTVGAGDTYHGAFSFAMLQGWDLTKVVEFSNAVSALKCCRLGGRAGIPTLTQVEAFLKEGLETINYRWSPSCFQC